MRRAGTALGSAVLFTVACTRLNPAFDEQVEAGDDLSTDTSSDTADTDVGDLPSSVCEFQPSTRLAIHFLDPADFGGGCPNGVDVSVRIASAQDGVLYVNTCNDDCSQCPDDPRPLSLAPLPLTNHVPADLSACLRVQTGTPLGLSADACSWGALSIFDSLQLTPFVIATTRSSEPTPAGAEALAERIPDPKKAGSCDCDAVGQSNECCYAAPGSPEFWYYPWDGAQLFPGETAPIDLPDPQNRDHVFAVLQAERLYSCESQDLELGWAVLATL